MRLLNLFVDVDDFCQAITTWSPQHFLGRAQQPGRRPTLAASEVITLIIYFHMSRYRDFKT